MHLYDIKFSETNKEDHDGWYLLDGREITALVNQTAIDNFSKLQIASFPDARNRLFQAVAGSTQAGSYSITELDDYSIQLEQEHIPSLNSTLIIPIGHWREKTDNDNYVVTVNEEANHTHIAESDRRGYHSHKIMDYSVRKVPRLNLATTTNVQALYAEATLSPQPNLSLDPAPPVPQGKHSHELGAWTGGSNGTHIHHFQVEDIVTPQQDVVFNLPTKASNETTSNFHLRPLHIKFSAFIYLGK